MMAHPERMPERDAAIEAMLPHVPFDGWTKRALKAGVRSAGMPDDEADLLFPLGVVDMIETFCDLADRRMEEAAKTIERDPVLRPRARGDRAAAGAKPAAQGGDPARAGGAGAAAQRPRGGRLHGADGRRHLHAAGDRSADFSWYTKRAILAGIYSATLLYWLRDMSEDDAATLAFLDRRLAGVGRIGRLRKRVEGLAGYHGCRATDRCTG